MADSIDEYYELCEFCDYDIRLTAKLVYREFKKDWITKKAGSDNRQRELFTKLYKLRYKESRIIEDDERPELIATFTAFDEEIFEVKIDDKLVSSDDLMKLAILLKIAEKQLKEGIKEWQHY